MSIRSLGRPVFIANFIKLNSKKVKSILNRMIPRRLITTGCIMPKNKGKKSSKVPDTDTVQTSPADNSGAVTVNKNGSFTIHILAKPGAQQNNITDISEERVGIQISAPPVDGEANTELIRYLSKVLSVRKSELSLETGSKSRSKSICVTSSTLNREAILELLKQQVENR